MRARYIVTAALLTLCFEVGASATPEIPAAPASAVVPVSISDAGMVSLAVRIDGLGPFNFILDTGSNRTVISDRLSRQLALPTVASTALVTPGSSASAEVVRLGELAIGPARKSGLLAPVIAVARMKSFDARADGLIGQDFLIEHSYTIDYQRREMAWHETLPASITGRALALKHDEGRWLVALPQAGPDKKDRVLWFVPDSGAQAFVLFDRGKAPVLSLQPIPGAGAATVAGSTIAKGALVAELRVGDLQFNDQPVVVIDRREPDAPAGDGLLPLSAFARVTFNAADRSLIVTGRRWRNR